FAAGHPEGALNVPVLFFRAGGSSPNPDFVSAVQRLVPPNTPLLVGCQAGGRSQRGAELLVAAGYTHVRNLRGGFGGARRQRRRASGRHRREREALAGWRFGSPRSTRATATRARRTSSGVGGSPRTIHGSRATARSTS